VIVGVGAYVWHGSRSRKVAAMYRHPINDAGVRGAGADAACLHAQIMF
jgi:hypothetical protein